MASHRFDSRPNGESRFQLSQGTYPSPYFQSLDLDELRLESLTSNIQQDRNLIGGYAGVLRYEGNLSRRMNYLHQLDQLRTTLTEYEEEYNELQAKIAVREPEKLADLDTQLQEMGSKLLTSA